MKYIVTLLLALCLLWPSSDAQAQNRPINEPAITTTILADSLGNYIVEVRFTADSTRIRAAIDSININVGAATTPAEVAAMIEDSLNNYLTAASGAAIIEDSLNNYLTAASVAAMVSDSITAYQGRDTTGAGGAGVAAMIEDSLNSYLVIASVAALVSDSITAYQGRDTTGAGGAGVDGGLSLDLQYYFNRNVKVVHGTDDYANWGNYNSGTYADDTTHYLTDGQAIEITMPASAGGTYYTKSINFSIFSDGSAVSLADYLTFSVHIDSAAGYNYLDSLPSNVAFMLSSDSYPTATNYYLKNISSGSLAVGWNHFAWPLSTVYANRGGAPDSSSIDWVLIYANGAPAGEAKLSIDNIQMVRADSAGSAPNPFQREVSSGVWLDEWVPYNTVLVVEESGRLSAMGPGENVDKLASVGTWDSYDITGRVLLANASVNDLYMSDYAASRTMQILASLNRLRIKDSTGTNHDFDFVSAPNDVIEFRAIRKTTALTVIVSNGGVDAVGSTFAYSGARKIGLRFVTGQRILSFGASTTRFASQAGTAQNLEWMFWRNDTLFIRNAGVTGDSLGWIKPTGLLKE